MTDERKLELSALDTTIGRVVMNGFASHGVTNAEARDLLKATADMLYRYHVAIAMAIRVDGIDPDAPYEFEYVDG